ncbi:MAG TPA: hypothetical protein VFG91_03875 [Woeseiaceae bacterium]|nr:hypothetical protein [Woeseiaceae bacterium]
MLRGFAAPVLTVQRIPEILDLAPVVLCHSRVQQRLGASTTAIARRIGAQLLETGGDALQIVLDQPSLDSLPDRPEDVLPLPFEPDLLGYASLPSSILRGSEGIQMFRVFRAEDVEEIRPHEMGLQGREHRIFQFVPGDRLSVGANRLALVLGRRTPVVGRVYLRVSAAAYTTLDEAGEQVTWAVSLPHAGRSGVEVPLPGFGRIPQLLWDDAQLGQFLRGPLAFVVQPRDAPPGLRVLDEALAVPYQPSDIEFVVKDAGAAPAVAVDRGLRPGIAGRRGDPFRIQFRRDRSRGFVA